MNPIEDFFPLLTQPSNIVITTHLKPDGDAMGSSLGLYHFLTQLGHSATVISPTNWANFLDWMPGANAVIDFEKNKDQSAALVANAQFIFCLDFNVLSRTKNFATILDQAHAQKILIDHHEQPQIASFAYGISNPAKSSTAEMVYDLISESGHADKITNEVAQCLYTGVMTDTGSFRFAAAGASVHKMVAHFKTLGLQHTPIHNHIYDNFLEERLRFIGHVLLNRMEVFYEENVALIAVSKADLIKYHIQTGDTEGLVNYPLSIQGIKMAAIVIDRDEERKWSFRSKGEVDVNTFARNFFEGGGHYNAAGGRSSASLSETVSYFKEVIKHQKQIFQ